MEERTVRTAFIFPFPDTIPTAITRAWSGRVPGPLLRRAVSSSDRDRRCLLKPPWLNLGAPGRRRLAGSPSIYRYPPPRAMASASPGQASRTSLQSRWATRYSPPATPHPPLPTSSTIHWPLAGARKWVAPFARLLRCAAARGGFPFVLWITALGAGPPRRSGRPPGHR